MTVADVAKALGISPGRVRQLIALGTFGSERLSHLLVIPKADYERYVKEKAEGKHTPGRPRNKEPP